MAGDDHFRNVDVERLAGTGREIRASIRVLELLGSRDHAETDVRVQADRELAQLLSACARVGESHGCDEILVRLGRLELMLGESLARAAERCSIAADALALREEGSTERAAAAPELSACAIGTLARRLTGAAADWRLRVP